MNLASCYRGGYWCLWCGSEAFIYRSARDGAGSGETRERKRWCYTAAVKISKKEKRKKRERVRTLSRSMGWHQCVILCAFMAWRVLILSCRKRATGVIIQEMDTEEPESQLSNESIAWKCRARVKGKRQEARGIYGYCFFFCTSSFPKEIITDPNSCLKMWALQFLRPYMLKQYEICNGKNLHIESIL